MDWAWARSVEDRTSYRTPVLVGEDSDVRRVEGVVKGSILDVVHHNGAEAHTTEGLARVAENGLFVPAGVVDGLPDQGKRDPVGAAEVADDDTARVKPDADVAGQILPVEEVDHFLCGPKGSRN